MDKVIDKCRAEECQPCAAFALMNCVPLHYHQNVLPGRLFMLEEFCFASDGGGGEEVLRS